jgi:predicted metal-binding protein
MNEEKIRTQVEVYVCNHSRDGSKACAELGAKEVTDKLKKWAKEEHKGEIKVYRSGCLGKCDEGIAIACYPEKKFLLEVTTDDTKEIKHRLKDLLK